MNILLNKSSRLQPHYTGYLMGILMLVSSEVLGADLFMSMGMSPEFIRDFHGVMISGDVIASARTNDGQHAGISFKQIGLAANIWNNEHNQVLAGIEHGRREFGQKLALPDGFVMPGHVDEVSASFLYKHITAGDWSLNQSVRYTQSRTDNPAVSVKDTIDLVGMAVVSYEPGEAWAFGYLYDQKSDVKNHFYPAIAYINNAHDKWKFAVGYPMLSVNFSPHPDWALGNAGISYKVTEQNILRFSIAGNNWAYRLLGPAVQAVAYRAQRVGLDWTYAYAFDHHTAVIMNAAVGREFNRELGGVNKLTLDNAKFAGLNVALTF